MNPADETPLRIEIAGKIREFQADEIDRLDVVRDGDAWHLLVDGQGHSICVESYDADTRTAVFRIDGELREARQVTSLDLLIDQMGLNKTLARKASALHAPMPGLVKGILVKPGDQVEKGAPLLILEAMKMENVMTAPDAVRIKHVDVKLTQPVDKGTRLIEFEID